MASKFIFGVSTTQLARLCRYESGTAANAVRLMDIDAGGYERATVSAKRILQAMSCERGSDYVEYARITARTLLTAKFGEAELDEGFIIGVIGLDSTEEYERFEDFLKRAGDDSVALGDDFGSKMLNAPGGEFRVF